MKDETSQRLFRKFGVIGAVFVSLGAVVGAMVVGIICGRLAFEMGGSEFLARVVGFLCGSFALSVILGRLRRTAENSSASGPGIATPAPALARGALDSPYSPRKIKRSLIGAAILSGVVTLDLFVGVWGMVPGGDFFGGIWVLVAFISSPIGTYRGCLAFRLSKVVTFALTGISFIPPFGLVAHIVFLLRMAKG